MGVDPISMGLIADVAAPALSSILGPILQSATQSAGAQGAQGAGGLGQVAQEAEQLIQQFMKMFGGMGQQGGYTPGLTPQSPFPFSPGPSGISNGIFDNPSQFLPQVGSGFNFGSGTQGIGSGFGGSSSSSGLGSLAGQWGSIQNELQQAEQSGNPAQIAQATQDEENYMNMVQMISKANSIQSQTVSQIISNMNG